MLPPGSDQISAPGQKAAALAARSQCCSSQRCFQASCAVSEFLVNTLARYNDRTGAVQDFRPAARRWSTTTYFCDNSCIGILATVVTNTAGRSVLGILTR